MKKIFFFLNLIIFCSFSLSAFDGRQNIATFSIVAYDTLMEEWGVAVQSKFFAVGAVVPQAKAGVGAIATQAWGNTTFKEKAIQLFSEGYNAKEVVERLIKDDPDFEYRQIGVVDKDGNSCSFTGKNCSPYAGHIVGKNYAVQGNILYSEEVLKNMALAFETTKGPLGIKLIEALKAGQKAGGDKRGMQSAALLVVSKNGGYSGFDDRIIDLRVDDDEKPIEELERLYYINEETFLISSYIRIAVDAIKENKDKKAEEAFNRVETILNKYDQSADMYNSVAWEMAINNYKLEKALKYAKKAIDLKKDDANIWDTLGEIYYRMKNIKKAIESEKKAVELAPDEKLFKEKLEEWQKKK